MSRVIKTGDGRFILSDGGALFAGEVVEPVNYEFEGYVASGVYLDSEFELNLGARPLNINAVAFSGKPMSGGPLRGHFWSGSPSGFYAAQHVEPEHFIITGASIMRDAFQGQSSRDHFASEVLSRTGRSVSVYNEAVGSRTIQAQVDAMPSIISNNSSLPADHRTVVFLHIGGNDVSANRPYAESQDDTVIASMRSGLNELFDIVEAQGWRLILADLTFRNYDGDTYLNEDNGSLPYTISAHQHVLAQRAPQFTHADGRSWADLYTAVYNNYDDWLSGDNLHMTEFGSQEMRNFIVNSIAVPLIENTIPTPLTKVSYT